MALTLRSRSVTKRLVALFIIPYGYEAERTPHVKMQNCALQTGRMINTKGDLNFVSVGTDLMQLRGVSVVLCVDNWPLS